MKVPGHRLVREAPLRTLTVMMILVIMGLQGYMLWWAWQDTWREGVREAQNTLNALSTAIERNLTLMELSLQGAQEALQEPGIFDISPVLRNRVLFDRATSAQYIGAFMILDSHGSVRFSSASASPPNTDFADREYFQVQVAPGVGTFVSRPILARIGTKDQVIALSRRLSGPDGSFEGVAAIGLRLQYFRDLFKGITLRPGSSLQLFRTDAVSIIREPPLDGAAAERIARAAADGFYREMLVEPMEPRIERSNADGVQRLYVYKRIGKFPLVLTVGTSLVTLLETWVQRAAITGLLTLSVCALLAVTVGALSRALRRSREMEAQLEAVAVTDALTGIPNRRAFDEVLTSELRRAGREVHPLSLLMIDVDHFKRVNDTFGHEVGDRVLQQMAALIQGSVHRPGDCAARYGGEEFVVLLPGTPPHGAQIMAEHIRTVIECAQFQRPGEPMLRATVSVGVATARRSESGTSLVRRSDAAMYRAKARGRNCVEAETAPAPA